MNTFSLIFLLLLACALVFQLWLGRRHIAHVRACSHRVPRPFDQRITLDAHRKAAAYTVARARFEMAALIYHSLLLLVWTLGGGLAALDRAWRAMGWGEAATGVAVILGVLFVSALLDLPLRLWRTYVIEQDFGFNRTGPALFATDLLREGLITLSLAGPLAALVLWLMNDPAGGLRPLWWLYAWLAWNGFSLLMLWLYPACIAPLFNRFTVLRDPALETRIRDLLRRAGFAARGIFVMDGSRRSAHGNAYFTGLGRHKRIVFYDTLLQALAADEVEAVLAHELGHFRHHHVHKRLAAGAALSLAGLLLLNFLMGQAWFFAGLGVTRPSAHLGLLLFTFTAPVFGYFLSPLPLWLSRLQEFQADAYAARHTSAAALARALLRLYEDNAATLTPDPLYSAFHDSHPPAPLRIARLLQGKETREPCAAS
ncbi:MAG TPA: M48 family peptidase [Gammaproteobacteria bacterium]|nr:M48 family peptidase [Gammaproteobacteria bacterium]